jgi:hypothetical protein
VVAHIVHPVCLTDGTRNAENSSTLVEVMGTATWGGQPGRVARKGVPDVRCHEAHALAVAQGARGTLWTTAVRDVWMNQLSKSIRSRCAAHILEVSDSAPNEAAIYALADPRDIEQVRYIGQTRSPRARLLQHMAEARPSLPDESPWWVKSPHLRPLYTWIRELYAQEQRLPLMMLVAWTSAPEARQEEGTYIREYLRNQIPLLNWETDVFQHKSPVSSARTAALRAMRTRSIYQSRYRPPLKGDWAMRVVYEVW